MSTSVGPDSNGPAIVPSALTVISFNPPTKAGTGRARTETSFAPFVPIPVVGTYTPGATSRSGVFLSNDAFIVIIVGVVACFTGSVVASVLLYRSRSRSRSSSKTETMSTTQGQQARSDVQFTQLDVDSPTETRHSRRRPNIYPAVAGRHSPGNASADQLSSTKTDVPLFPLSYLRILTPIEPSLILSPSSTSISASNSFSHSSHASVLLVPRAGARSPSQSTQPRPREGLPSSSRLRSMSVESVSVYSVPPPIPNRGTIPAEEPRPPPVRRRPLPDPRQARRLSDMTEAGGSLITPPPPYAPR